MRNPAGASSSSVRRGLLLILVLFVGSVLAAPARGATSLLVAQPAVGTAPLPPELQALQQKAQSLRVSSERFSAEEWLDEGAASLLGGSSKLPRYPATKASLKGEAGVPFVSLTGTQSFLTGRAEFQGSLFGKLKTGGRIIGSTDYAYEPVIAKLDGGRPWVRSHGRSIKESLKVGPLGSNLELGGAGGPFTTVFAMLDQGQPVQQRGAVEVDGQSAVGFNATIAASQLVNLEAKQREALEKLKITSIAVEVFIASSGLPVRTSYLFQSVSGGITTDLITVRSDVLALNVPVSVHAPPARRTITDAALTKLLRKTARIRLHSVRPTG